MIKRTIFNDLFTIWLMVQHPLAKVERWGSYRERNKRLRRQSTLHHQYSVCVVILPVLLKLKLQYSPKLDSELVKDGFMLHDIPEALLQMDKDVQFLDKKDHHDLSEYMAFKKYFEHLEPCVYEHMHRAYLLQFAHKSDEAIDIFPDEAKSIILMLRETHPYEVALFPALEQWEYLFYAYECFKKKKDEVIFLNVLRTQVPRLQRHAQEIIGFREVVFPIHFEQALLAHIENNSHVPNFH